MRLGAIGRLLVALVAVSLVTATCDGDGKEAERSPPSGSMSPTSSKVLVPGCDNAAEAVADESRRKPGLLEGDVDGDGSSDSISIAIDEQANPPCQAFLVVESHFGTLAQKLQSEGMRFELDLPSLNSLAAVDPRPGFEIIVNLVQGASTSFAGLYTVTNDGLETVNLPGRDGSFRDLFAHGGSVGHIDAADCASDQRVVMSAAVPAGSGGNRYRVKRRFLSFEGSDLVLETTERQTARANRLGRFPEFRQAVFGNCSGP